MDTVTVETKRQGEGQIKEGTQRRGNTQSIKTVKQRKYRRKEEGRCDGRSAEIVLRESVRQNDKITYFS